MPQTEIGKIKKAYYGLLQKQTPDESSLDYSILDKHKPVLYQLADFGKSSIGVFDVFKKQHVLYIDNIAGTLGYEKHDIESSNGHFLDNKIHPDDFLMLMKNGITIFKLFINFSENEKMNHKLINEYRIKNAAGDYIRVIEQHQVLELDGNGNLWLSMSILDISPNQETGEEMKSQVLNFRTGKFMQLQATGPEVKISLTQREKEILQLVKKGLLSKEISDKLCISLHTVNTHRQRVLEKMSANNSMEAVILASKHGLI